MYLYIFLQWSQNTGGGSKCMVTTPGIFAGGGGVKDTPPPRIDAPASNKLMTFDVLRHTVHFQQNAWLIVVSSSFINVGNNNQKHVFTYIV